MPEASLFALTISGMIVGFGWWWALSGYPESNWRKLVELAVLPYNAIYRISKTEISDGVLWNYYRHFPEILFWEIGDRIESIYFGAHREFVRMNSDGYAVLSNYTGDLSEHGIAELKKARNVSMEERIMSEEKEG